MIACTGIDRVGKTTLALYLRDNHGYAYRHFTKPPVPAYRYLLWQLADGHPRMVLDRLGHHDETVYGPIYRSQMSLTPRQWNLTELALQTLGCVCVHLTDSAESVRSRWTEDEMHASWGVEALLDSFTAVARGESWPRSRLPIATFTLPELLDGGQPTAALRELVALAREREQRATLLPPPSLFLGSVDAEFLVVGEAPCPSAPPGDAQGADPDLPFSRGPAADWLWRALEDLGVQHWRGAFTNASTYDRSTSHWWWFRALRQHMRSLRAVVCLGERAAKLVHEGGRDGWRVSCSHAWHPSYVKRFRHKQYPAWRDELGVALADWSDSARLALESGGYADGSEAAPGPLGSSPAPGATEPLAPDEKARTCVACRGRGILADEDEAPERWPPCAACDSRGYVIRTAS